KDINPIHFYKSRAFRIFPIYYVGAFIAIFVSFGAIREIFDQLPIGAKIFFIFQNLFIFGQDLSFLVCVKNIASQCVPPMAMQINMPAWSLAIELGFYLLAPFILKSEKKTFAFVLLGCGYLLSINLINFPVNSIDTFRAVNTNGMNYFFYPSSFAFFGGGALAYHLSKKKSQPHYYAAVFALILFSFTETVMPFWHLLFISMAIPVLFDYTAKNRLDRSIGELSYPAYILHYPILAFIKPFTNSHPQYFSLISLGSWVAIVSCVIGLLLYLYIEKRINKYRESKTFFSNLSTSKNNFVRAAVASLIIVYLASPFAVVSYIYMFQKETITPVNLTDRNWVNGIGKTISGFFCDDTPQNLEQLRIGSTIRFVNGERRQIVRVEQADKLLTVYVNGEPLDGKQVGFPNKIVIVTSLNDTPYNLTDDNWISGVGRKVSGFIVGNSRENMDYYQVGKFVKFANGDTRQIIRVDQSDQYLTVDVNGEPLDGEQVGFPNKIEILK
ncbi:MAG: acyltransferase, partial [Methylobacter sp.]